MDYQSKTDSERSLVEKAKDALHNAAEITKELAEKVKETVAGGGRVTDAQIADAEEDVAILEDKIRGSKLEEEYFALEKERAAGKLADHEEGQSKVADKEAIDAAELAEKERLHKLRAQQLEAEKQRAEEKVVLLKQKKEEQCHEKCHEAMKRNDRSTEFSGTTQTTGIH